MLTAKQYFPLCFHFTLYVNSNLSNLKKKILHSITVNGLFEIMHGVIAAYPQRKATICAYSLKPDMVLCLPCTPLSLATVLACQHHSNLVAKAFPSSVKDC